MTDEHLTANRRAFTLLEVVIASGLATLLILLVWSLFGILSKLNDRGAAQATELQLVRSLMRQLRSDLHHARAALAPKNGGTATGAGGDASWPAAHGDPTDVPTLPNGAELRGSSTWLQMVLRASPRGEADSTDSSSSSTADGYALVEYFWRPRGTRLPGDPARDDSHQPLFSDGEPTPLPAGLTRQVNPRFAVSGFPIAGRFDGTLTSMPPQSGNRLVADPDRQGVGQPETEDAVPEVAVLRFRYYDGANWLSHWDSGQTGRLPAAIEVAFDLQPEQQAEDESTPESADVDAAFEPAEPITSPTATATDKITGTSVREESEHEYRFVIAVDTTAWRHAPERVAAP